MEWRHEEVKTGREFLEFRNQPLGSLGAIRKDPGKNGRAGRQRVLK